MARETPKKLTQKQIDALKPGALQVIRDGALPGFMVRVTKSTVSYALQRELWIGERRHRTLERTVRLTIGRREDMKLDAARDKAAELLRDIARGIDPTAGKAAPAVVWTLEHAYGQYLEGHTGELTVKHMNARLERYLKDWRKLPLAEITRDMVTARHKSIQAGVRDRARGAKVTGASAANKTLKDVRAVYAHAAELTDLPRNPTNKIKLVGEVRGHHEIPLEELPAWHAKVALLTNPLRASMHLFGLYSGCRPGNVMGLEREWIDLPRKRIRFPAAAMKGRAPFTLPLSGRMIELLEDALEKSEVLFHGAKWVFPTRDRDGSIIATATPREKTLGNHWGHALRHTWKTCARLAQRPGSREHLAESQIELLMAHKLGGMSDRYGSIADQFDRLLEDQETVTQYIDTKLSK